MKQHQPEPSGTSAETEQAAASEHFGPPLGPGPTKQDVSGCGGGPAGGKPPGQETDSSLAERKLRSPLAPSDGQRAAGSTEIERAARHVERCLTDVRLLGRSPASWAQGFVILAQTRDFAVERNVRVPGNGYVGHRSGRIGFVLRRDGVVVAVESNLSAAKARSLYKLRHFECDLRYVGLRLTGEALRIGKESD